MPKKVKKEKVKQENTSKAVDVAIRSLQKQFGAEVVNWLDKTPEVSHSIIPTGSLGLDAALGVGGFVKGRIYELYGPHSSGKTTLALSAIREVQRLGGKAVYVDAEHTHHKGLMRDMGIDLNKIVIVQGYTGEQNLDVAKTLISTGEFDVCVIDSISALQPAAEANLASYDDQTMALLPRLMARMARDFTPVVARTGTALLLINQIRANIGSYSGGMTTSGGNALQHHYSGRVKVTGGAIKSRQIKNKKGEVVGHRASFEITKNKLAPPFRTAEADLIYGRGFHLEGELLDLGVEMGFIDQAGSWFSYNGEKLAQGRDKTVQEITENKEILNKLTNEVKGVLGFADLDKVVVPDPVLEIAAGDE